MQEAVVCRAAPEVLVAVKDKVGQAENEAGARDQAVPVAIDPAPEPTEMVCKQQHP